MGVERPYRRSTLLTIVGVSLIMYSLLLLYALLAVDVSDLGFSLKLMLTLLSVPTLVLSSVSGVMMLKTRLPKPSEQLHEEYKELLEKVKRELSRTEL